MVPLTQMGPTMTNPHQYLLGTAFIVVAVTASLQLSGCTSDYLMDENDRCLMSHVWETTTVSTGRPIYECPGWYRERQVLDGKAVKK